MKADRIDIVTAPDVRKSLTNPGDIKSDIDFQNDVNRLLARFEEKAIPWRPLAQLTSFGVGPAPTGYRRRNSVMEPFQVFDGGQGARPGSRITQSYSFDLSERSSA